MKYYEFDPETGVYRGSRTPQIDPLESQKEGRAVYTQPGLYETANPPPAVVENQAACWRGGTWQIEPDYRGQTWYDADGDLVTIDKVGNPEEWELTPERPALPPKPLTADDYAAAIQAHVDMTARSKGYTDGVACASYITSSMPGWQAEAAAFVAWRDSVWLAAYLVMGQVQAGQRPAPTIEDLIAELPAITWPGD